MIENIERFANGHKTLIAVIISVLVICFLYWWFCCKDRPLVNKVKGGSIVDTATDFLEELEILYHGQSCLASIFTNDKDKLPIIVPSEFVIKFVKAFANFIFEDDNFYLNKRVGTGIEKVRGVDCLCNLLLIDKSDYGKKKLMVLHYWFEILISGVGRMFYRTEGIGQVFTPETKSQRGKISIKAKSVPNLAETLSLREASHYKAYGSELRRTSDSLKQIYKYDWMSLLQWRYVSRNRAKFYSNPLYS